MMYRTLCVNSLNAMSSCGSKSVATRRPAMRCTACRRPASWNREDEVLWLPRPEPAATLEKVETALELRLQPDAHRFYTQQQCRRHERSSASIA